MTVTAKLSLPLKALAIVAAMAGWGQAQANQGDTYGAPVESFSIKSKNVDQTFEINVYVPEACKKKRCSTLYFADSDVFFGPISGLMGAIDHVGVPQQVVVGIGYPGNAVTSNWHVLRLRDLLFEMPEDQLERIKGLPYADLTLSDFGKGAPKFLDFIREELFPIIENRYPVLPNDRTYFGISGGSRFGWYTMFTKSDSFKRYVLGSSAPRFYIDTIREFAQQGKSLDAKLFFATGLDESLEHYHGDRAYFSTFVADYIEYAALLHELNIPGLEFSHKAWPDETHFTAWVPTFMHGMRAVFLSDCKPYVWRDGKCPDVKP